MMTISGLDGYTVAEMQNALIELKSNQEWLAKHVESGHGEWAILPGNCAKEGTTTTGHGVSLPVGKIPGYVTITCKSAQNLNAAMNVAGSLGLASASIQQNDPLYNADITGYATTTIGNVRPVLAQLAGLIAKLQKDIVAAAPGLVPVTAQSSFFSRYKKALLIGGAITLSAIGVGVTLLVRRKK